MKMIEINGAYLRPSEDIRSILPFGDTESGYVVVVLPHSKSTFGGLDSLEHAKEVATMIRDAVEGLGSQDTEDAISDHEKEIRRLVDRVRMERRREQTLSPDTHQAPKGVATWLRGEGKGGRSCELSD